MAIVYHGLGDLPHSGKLKSAVVKTGELAASGPAANAGFSNHTLLCRALRSPAEVSFTTTRPQLAGFWRPIRLLWEQNHRVEALSAIAEAAWRSEPDAGGRIPALFLMAHMRMDNGDAVGAEQCLQSAVKQLGHQAGMPVKSSGHAGSRIPAFETTSPYALCDRDWLILAIQALLKNDLESCLLWIRQADRSLLNSVSASESPQRLRLIGDLHAVLACVAVQADEMDEAEKHLATGYQRHVQAEAFQSVCRDLILTSRLAVLRGQLERAKTLLDAAECQLVLALIPDETDCSPLMEIIHADRRRRTCAVVGIRTFQQIRQV